MGDEVSVVDHHTSESRRTVGGTAWQTYDELIFLRRLGTHTEQGLKTPKVILLQRYLTAATLRHDWGKIDKAAAIRVAETLLRAEQRKQGKAKGA